MPSYKRLRKRSLPVIILLSSLVSSIAFGEEVIKSHALAMYGDAKYPADFQHFDYASNAASKGGQLRLAAQGSFDSLNPFIAKGHSAQYIGLIYDSLMTQSADEVFSGYGLLAESVELPKDHSWIIFNLRPQARFSDGETVNADDVVYTFNLLIEHGSPFYSSYYADVESVTALSPQRVKFQFKPGVNRELALIIGQLQILPKHFWESRDFSASSLELPLGSGPYRLSAAEPGKNVVFERNEDYWGKDLAVNTGFYNFDHIQVDYYKDAVVLLEALKAGQYDFRSENSAKQWATGYTGPAIASGQLKKDEIKHNNPTGMQAFLFNLRKPLFADIRVRKALTYAFDFEWSNRNLFYDLYKRTESYFSNSELASSGLPGPEELAILAPFKKDIPESIFDAAFTLPVSDGSGHNRQNLRIAMGLLKEAGWQVVNNQLVHRETGQQFRFEIILAQPSFERVVNPYIQSLKKLGITANVRNVEISQYINRMRSFDFDMVVGGMGQSLSPGNEQLEYWGSANADTEGSMNYMGIKNPVVDALVQEVISAPDRQQLIFRTRALDRVLLNNYYLIPQWHSDSHRIAYWNKFDRPAIAPKYDPGYSIGLWTWWYDPEKAGRITHQAAPAQ